MNKYQTKKTLLALCAAVGLGGCGSLDIGDLNNPSLDAFRDNPTVSGINSASTGLLLGHRAGVSAPNGYVAQLGVIGREAYVFDPADPRAIDEMLGPILDPGAAAFGGNYWTGPYANIRNANTLLAALEKVAGLSDAQKEGVRGFAKTMQALDFLVVINTRDTNGAPIDVDRPLGADLAPIVGKAEVFAHIAGLLDTAAGHLDNAGASFSFRLSTGFNGFDTPATFRTFNRAVRARVAVYMGRNEDALTALSQSFIASNAPAEDGAKAAALASLNIGVYHVFRAASGDADNGLLATTVFAHPSIATDAETVGAGGPVDDRVTRKTTKLDAPVSAADGKLTTDLRFTLYTSADASVPIIRNEELILLRAEANLGLGQIGPAVDDINYIRTRSGRLPARADITAENALDELLKQKRYSLMFEGGHRWIDMRRYGKLDELPRNLDPNVPPHSFFPIPVAEVNGRQ
ncbi:RagB/SusD family nutrient uptake outer membrane protein [Myxococcus sp. K38C18041901]|uniref:RagB/SusD family nutrient uptake outer membrane protein n=1 Tax=Myxococcus guangdongensis TaxID=2906760 RepID=UPI0020A796C8|nr:RagB/SusD family nutrient uptake outer membrane protein [Myxococcus guangdongensis]MCP3057194.1 RagB/SusD family nutrient uptake outer membrane protein [Myxococcus guangdongensis]